MLKKKVAEYDGESRARVLWSRQVSKKSNKNNVKHKLKKNKAKKRKETRDVGRGLSDPAAVEDVDDGWKK